MGHGEYGAARKKCHVDEKQRDDTVRNRLTPPYQANRR